MKHMAHTLLLKKGPQWVMALWVKYHVLVFKMQRAVRSGMHLLYRVVMSSQTRDFEENMVALLLEIITVLNFLGGGSA